MAIKFIDEVDLKGKTVLARFDFNVPLDKADSSKITDTTRIDEALSTINLLIKMGVKKLIMMSHLGRPKGPEKKYSLLPVATYLAQKLEEEVVLTESAVDAGIKTLLTLSHPRLILLENLRFQKEEEANDPAFAKTLASYAEYFVNDAFGTAHRKHASTYGVVQHFKNKALGGLLLRREIEALDKIVHKPQHPFVAIMGGAKVSDKIKIIENILSEVDQLLIGGAMAYPFLAAKGVNIGKSLCSAEDVKLAKSILQLPTGQKIMLPIDHIVSDSLEGKPIPVSTAEIPDNLIGLDIGPNTLKKFKETLKNCKTVLWNGPMGYFENSNFASGTFAVAQILSELSNAFTLVGGGDSVSAVKQSGVEKKIGHVSTGGGASLEYIEEGSLVGINALKFGVH
ncbi:MAG: phosphoglycerate kinase [Bdellovibrionales bacterium GWA2_49_15]|nr:MAG: phosphoglycerate kinase [Bdellovibrionales bacterium GWA2_49_15]HAZ11864.1 phosphoglycerate kinase [Bdellovibrionales bacterium]